MGRARGLILCILILSGLGCDAERQRLMKEQYPFYPERIRRAIQLGTVMRGMTEEQVYVSLGAPACKRDIQRQGTPIRVWLYPPIGRDACMTADFRVYFEEGQVTTWDHFMKAPRFTDPPGGAP